ncbi:hypothetical protein [Fuchsiella alkaliacetigena]|uniref:hypothetical protein n=1 Tax=Fuchsiella alkaliacetigena TaxID=957042 RepID=UPI002009F956|nr:hypothetical protein [Fuchsiella alkaliacetigena]MCK8825096.1 hypothetical protein [Fuchsiella alkaliacetigena]
MPGLLIEIGNNFLKGIMLLVSYVKKNNAFPHPLEPEEEKEYLERLKEGEEEVKDILIEHNLRLVAHIVKKFDKANLWLLQNFYPL